MNTIKTLAALALAVGVSACGTVDTATRNAPIGESVVPESAPQYSVTEINVSVPTTLRVSEANLFYPLADIVWRGDAYGNRYEQVATIMRDGLSMGASQLRGPRPVILDVQVARFHSLTERARYVTGGTHSIKFDLTVRDADTGAVIEGPRRINGDLPAWGGSRAVAAERNGITQKLRITNHLAGLIQRELGLFPEARASVETTAVITPQG